MIARFALVLCKYRPGVIAGIDNKDGKEENDTRPHKLIINIFNQLDMEGFGNHGGILHADDVRQIRQRALNQKPTQTLHLSKAYLDCVKVFNSAQLLSDAPVGYVACPSLLGDMDKKLLQESLSVAGFDNYWVRDDLFRTNIEIINYIASQRRSPAHHRR